MNISAVVCTYNREKYLAKSLESIAKQTLSADNYEIIVINNNSVDNTKEVCDNFQNKNPLLSFKYFEETNQGLSYARNRGIRESSGELITFVDDDATLEKNFLKEVTDFLNKNKNIVAVGGKILLDYEEEKPKWISKYLKSLFGFFVFGEDVKPFKKPMYPRGSNMTFRRSIFENIGLFNVNLGRKGNNLEGNEEKDIFYRIYNKNFIVYYLPYAVVYHAVPEERTSDEFIKKQAEGIGVSERYRTDNEGKKEFLKRTLTEIKKWGASFVLFAFFLFILKPSKGIMILKFRYWVSRGFFNKMKKNV